MTLCSMAPQIYIAHSVTSEPNINYLVAFNLKLIVVNNNQCMFLVKISQTNSNSPVYNMPSQVSLFECYKNNSEKKNQFVKKKCSI